MAFISRAMLDLAAFTCTAQRSIQHAKDTSDMPAMYIYTLQ